MNAGSPLFEKFRTKAGERVRFLSEALDVLVEVPRDGASFETLRRELHTLKGEARLLGFDAVYLVATKLEQLVEGMDGEPDNASIPSMLRNGVTLLDELRGLDPTDPSAVQRAAPYCRDIDTVLVRVHGAARVSQDPPREPIESQPDDRRWRVLLIDDSEIALEVARSVLESAGFEVRATTTFDRFDDLLSNWSPEVILTDVKMPGMTGVELCRALKRRYETAHVPIVLCSSLPTGELAKLARQCDADGYVSKTERLETLAEELRVVCESIAW
jgi:CheY-like chemotaxis protein/HPt (histidine-containing phosphotransfer) domain-containing protein